MNKIIVFGLYLLIGFGVLISCEDNEEEVYKIEAYEIAEDVINDEIYPSDIFDEVEYSSFEDTNINKRSVSNEESELGIINGYDVHLHIYEAHAAACFIDDDIETISVTWEEQNGEIEANVGYEDVSLNFRCAR